MMELDSRVQDILAVWYKVVQIYIERPENKAAMDSIAFDHWTLFWRLLMSCMPSSSDDRPLWRAINAWKKCERDEVRRTLYEIFVDETSAWKTYTSLLAQARGHARCIEVSAEFMNLVKEAGCSTVLPTVSERTFPMDETIICEVDSEVLIALQSREFCDSLRVDWSAEGRPRIRLAASVPTIPPPSPVPIISCFCIKQSVGETDDSFDESEACTLAKIGR